MWIRRIFIFVINCCMNLWEFIRPIKWMSKDQSKSLRNKDLSLALCKPNTNWHHVAVVKEIYLYPLKYGKEMSFAQCSFTYSGMTAKNKKFHTEMFIVYDHNTKYIFESEDVLTKLDGITMTMSTRFLILQSYDESKCILWLKKFQHSKETFECTSFFCNKFIVKYTCVDCGSLAAEWISRVLGNSNLRLGYRLPQPQTHESFWEYYNLNCNVNQEERNITLPYTCIPAYTMMSLETLKNINKRISHPIQMKHYYPNIVFSYGTPFAENNWTWLKIGSAVFRNVRLSSKKLAEIEKVYPLDMRLKLLTMHCELICPGEVKVGDSIFVSTKE